MVRRSIVHWHHVPVVEMVRLVSMWIVMVLLVVIVIVQRGQGRQGGHVWRRRHLGQYHMHLVFDVGGEGGVDIAGAGWHVQRGLHRLWVRGDRGGRLRFGRGSHARALGFTAAGFWRWAHALP